MPSWQSQIASIVIRAMVKRRPPEDESRAVELVRGMLKERRWLRRPVESDLAAHAVDDGGVRGEWLEFPDRLGGRTLYYLHGGAYIACSPRTHRPLTSALTRRMRARTFVLDYRLAPEHRFPAAIEDAMAGYRWLLGQGIAAEEIVVAGDSAGGGLALALMVALRQAGLPMPAGAACLSPWTDLAVTGDSIERNERSDPMFYGDVVRAGGRIYLGKASPCDPLASPLYADLHGLPPLLVHVSGSEVLLDDSVRLADRAREAGVEVELKVWERLPHVWQILIGLAPEAASSLDEISEFLVERLQSRVMEYADNAELTSMTRR